MYYDRATTVLYIVLRTVLNTCRNRPKFYMRIPGRIWEKCENLLPIFFAQPPQSVSLRNKIREQIIIRLPGFMLSRHSFSRFAPQILTFKRTVRNKKWAE